MKKNTQIPDFLTQCQQKLTLYAKQNGIYCYGRDIILHFRDIFLVFCNKCYNFEVTSTNNF